jgi:hypothetical protein
MSEARRMTGCAQGNEPCECLYERSSRQMRHAVSEIRAEKLAQELKDLRRRGDDELRERWRCTEGSHPAKSSSPADRGSRLSNAGECTGRTQAFRPPSSNARRRKRAGWPTSTVYPNLSPKPGTVLVRDLGGATHQVKVLEDASSFEANDTNHFPKLRVSSPVCAGRPRLTKRIALPLNGKRRSSPWAY